MTADDFEERIEKARHHVARWREAAEIEHGRVLELRDLIRHCQIHSGYRNCGYMQMTTQQKALYDEIRAGGA